jgi:hypothetical protein
MRYLLSSFELNNEVLKGVPALLVLAAAAAMHWV